MQQTDLARAHIQDCECVRVAEGNFAKTLRTSQIALPKRRGARGWRERGAVLNASGLKCPFTMSVWPASGTRRTHTRSPERQAMRGRGRKRRARRSPFARTSTEQASASGVGERERESAGGHRSAAPPSSHPSKTFSIPAPLALRPPSTSSTVCHRRPT